MATTEITIQENAWVQISVNKAFTAQNLTEKPVLIRSDSSLPAASVDVGFLLDDRDIFKNGLTTKTWYATIQSKGDGTGKLVIDEEQ